MFRLIKTGLETGHIDIPNGENVLGRGPFLKVTDKRVSRNHALLICTEEKLELVPKHKNPCFYRKSGASDFTVLAKDVTQLLEDGDEFSLLPKELVFRIEKIQTDAPPDNGVPCSKCDNVEKKDIVNEEKEESVDKGREELVNKKELTPHKATHEEDKNISGAVASSKPRKLPSWLLAAAGDRTEAGEGVKKKESKSVKRTKSPEAVVDNKRIAVAKEDIMKPIVTEKAPKEPSSSKLSNEGDEVTDRVSDPDKSPPTVVDKLPPCPYGNKCYRKNPIHFKEYSHDPDDIIDDDEEEDKPACPYGTACYRKNPLHRKQYSHTGPPVADTGGSSPTRTSNRRPKRKAKVSALAGDSDDDGEPNTYDYDSFIDDADHTSEESTEYGGESEDSDWAPDVSEDVNELVDEAKQFMHNS